MRQVHKFTSKKMILLLSLLGVIPFYFELFFYLIYPQFYYKNILSIKGLSGFYGALIISFLSGMHWERLLLQKKVRFYIIPMFPVIFLWISFIFYSKLILNSLVIVGLLWCLFMEIFFIKQSVPTQSNLNFPFFACSINSTFKSSHQYPVLVGYRNVVNTYFVR